MTNWWTYWQLFSILKRWFISRWWDILCDDQWLMDYINLAILDVYNEDNASWRYVTETLEWVENWKYNKYITQYPIHKIQKCYPYVNDNEINYDETQDIKPTLFWIKDAKHCKFWWNEILTHKDVKKIEVTYLKDYVPATLAQKSELIPVPFRYIPVIITMAMDRAAPINLMSSESVTTDFFSRAITRNNKIKENDSLTDYIDVNPAY